MAGPGSYPPPNFNCPTQEPVLRQPTFHWNVQHQTQQTGKFKASQDWNWYQSPEPHAWSSGARGAHGNYSGACQPYYTQHRYLGPYHHENRYGGQGRSPNEWTKKQKRQKEPEFSHFCDTCDRGFKNQGTYDEHVAQHVKCSVEDCHFTAHEKLVKIHWKNNHAPGTKRIKLDTPDEIAKWREERRKNYPTLCNVEKKMKIMEAKEKRGDVLETAQFGRFKSRGRGRGRHNRGGRFQNYREGDHQSFHAGQAKAQGEPFPMTHPHQEGDPLDALARCDPETEKDDSVKVAVSVVPKNVTSALGSLMSSYGGDMTESEEESDDNPVLNAAKLLEENKTILAAHSVNVQKEAPKSGMMATNMGSQTRNQPPYPQSDQRHRGGCRGRRGQNNRGDRGRFGPNGPKKRHPTLLEMLLAPDVRHERNILLQCVRYIVHNGFFGLGHKDSNLMKPVTESGLASDNKHSGSVQTEESMSENGNSGMVTGCLDSQPQQKKSPEQCDKRHCIENEALHLQPERISGCSQAKASHLGHDGANVQDKSVCISENISATIKPMQTDQPRILPLLFAQNIVCDNTFNLLPQDVQPGESEENVDHKCQNVSARDSQEAVQPLSSRNRTELPFHVSDVRDNDASDYSSSNHPFDQSQDNIPSLLSKGQIEKSPESQQSIQSSHQELKVVSVSTAEDVTKQDVPEITNEEGHTYPVSSMYDDDIWEVSTSIDQ